MLESQEENLISIFLIQNVGWDEGQAEESVIQCACQLIITCMWHRGWHPGENSSTVTGLRVLQSVSPALHPGRSSFLWDSWVHPGSPSELCTQMTLQARVLFVHRAFQGSFSSRTHLLRVGCGVGQGVHGMPRKAVGMSLCSPFLASGRVFYH